MSRRHLSVAHQQEGNWMLTACQWEWLEHTLMFLTDLGVFLERTRAECKNRLYLHPCHKLVIDEAKNSRSDNSSIGNNDYIRCDDRAKERNCICGSSFPWERWDKHSLHHLSRWWSQVGQLSEEAARHGEHEGSDNELQFAGLPNSDLIRLSFEKCRSNSSCTNSVKE